METRMKFQVGAMGCNTGQGISPALCTFKDQMHCFYREQGNGRLMHIRSSDGVHWDIARQVSVADIKGTPCCAVVFWGLLHVFYLSGGIFHTRSSDGVTWETPYNIGRSSASGLSVAQLNDSFVLAYKDAGGYGVMYSKFTGGWTHGYTGHTSRAPRPGIAAYNGRYHMFYKDGGGNGRNRGVMHIFSDDGEAWMGATPFHVGNTETNASPSAIGYGAKLHLLHRQEGGTAILHEASVNGFEFEPAIPLNIGLDLYDGPSAAVLGNTLCVMGVEPQGQRIMQAIYKP